MQPPHHYQDVNSRVAGLLYSLLILVVSFCAVM